MFGGCKQDSTEWWRQSLACWYGELCQACGFHVRLIFTSLREAQLGLTTTVANPTLPNWTAGISVKYSRVD